MKFDQLVVLLPCRSLEEFSLQREADEAEQLLSAWCALWHPALLDSAQGVPRWVSAEEPPQDPTAHLVILPDCCQSLVPGDWLDRAEQAGACVLRRLQHRAEMVAAALERLDAGSPSVDADLAADFLALGFCHFQVEMLTRQMRYMSNLDETSFRTAVLAAAADAVRGDAPAARRNLQSAFDRLHESREYFYPVEAHLLDLTLVASTTLGEPLRVQLAGSLPTNLLASGEVIEEMARREPATLEALKTALEKNKAAVIGGEFCEGMLPLVPPEAMRRRIERGLAVYQRHLGARPTIFGRRRFGLSLALPPILNALGFSGALHCTLDDGRFPTGNQSRVQWEGFDATTIEALARVPVDISCADAFLRLPERLGNTMDLDHVATVVLAHWPGQSSPWYDDLRRIAGYTSTLGTFESITDYFSRTGYSGQRAQYQADQYHSPYLQQAVAGAQADPLSRWVRYFRRLALVEAAQTLEILSAACGAPAAPDETGSACPPAGELAWKVEEALDAALDNDPQLDQQLQARIEHVMGRFAHALCGPQPERQAEKGCLLANPWSFSRRLGVELGTVPIFGQRREASARKWDCPPRLPLSQLPGVAGAVRAAADLAGRKSAVVDLPAMGFAWVGPGAEEQPPQQPERKGWLFKKKPREETLLIEENTLSNDFFAVAIDRQSGAVRSIVSHNSRAPRLGQQIAMRLPGGAGDDPGHDSHYSIMAADEVTVTSPGPVLGEIVSRGRLMDRQSRRLAGFVQTTRVWRGSRVIEIDIELDVDAPPGPNPWNSYYAARFAWGDVAASLFRSVNLACRPTEVERLEAPHFIDIRAGDLRTTVLTGGLPCHRRCGTRKLDSLLIVRGETERRFRLGIGIDLPNPMTAALGFLAPPTVLSASPAPPAPSGWLFHLDARHVVATYWEPILSEGRTVGYRVRLLETEGRGVRLGLRSFRSVRAAHKVNAGDTPPTELAVEGDRVCVDMGPHAWVEVEARFE